ncbi:DUF6083 domain-containing protein [Streptomyces nanshensis]|nr:DUF6083 domain-containing protein [Streptomyces nanshensis]
MEVHRTNQSRLLRKQARGECAYCGTPVEWYDRYDARRIPLSPELPAAQIPERYQWHISRGVAYPGVDPRAPRYCRVPHPAMCPALEHADLPPELGDVVAVLAVRMRKRIDSGFVPTLPPAPGDDQERDGDEGKPSRRPGPTAPERVRHTVHYTGSLRLGPGPLEDLQCTAAREDGARCPNPVFVTGEGRWELLDLPHLPGRRGQMILSASNGKMWVWSLTTLDFPAAARWLRQRCPAHDDHTAAFCRPEWEDFHPLRHSDFIVARKPEGYEPAPGDGPTIHDGPRTLRQCAQTGCHNTTPAAVPDGWLCWQCRKRLNRRTGARRPQRRPGPPA